MDGEQVDNGGVLDVVIMAAGKGTRMKSALPKVLHRLAGRALLAHVMQCAARLQPRRIVLVTGHGATEVEAAAAGYTLARSTFDIKSALQCVRQIPPQGTGHAVQQAVPWLGDDGMTLVLSGDVPLTEESTLRDLLKACQQAGPGLALLTIHMDDPTGYGRVIRAGSSAAVDAPVRAIAEQKDATPQELAVREIYSGIMAAPTRHLKQWLAQLDNRNAQGEYYLTDVVKFAVAQGMPVVAHQITDAVQVAGVNSPVQLAELERAYQSRLARRFMEQGVRLADPARFDVRGELVCAGDVEIDVNCVFEGSVSLGQGVRIGANCVVANAQIAAGALVAPFTHIDGEAQGVTVGEGARIGPFARLRPGTQLGAQVHIGNFVEVKNSILAEGAKANHLAYVGDAVLGERVNVGAGTITANYDGANKHRTTIEADAHIGSNSVLVAPVTIGEGGTIGAGSVISKNTPPGALSVARGKQIHIANWQRPVKKKES
ncbi:MAG: bifunctional UDP-N-acetylglucosamine diphosphorylase/glucosamine-1-phosphate N-acetyltransferase GlmU [Burkholderiaceae bacterium]